MNDFDRQWCLKLLGDITKWPTTRPFHAPVNPTRDGAPTYYEIIEKPMDFTTIRKKINGGEYQTVDDYIDDMRLVCDNAKKFNGSDSIYGLICDDIIAKVQKEHSRKPASAEEEWFGQLQKSANKIMNHIRNAPPEVSHKTPAAFPSDFNADSVSEEDATELKAIIGETDIAELPNARAMHTEDEKTKILEIIERSVPKK